MLLSQCIYGGRIDNDFDQVSCVCTLISVRAHALVQCVVSDFELFLQRLLTSFVHRLFTVESFDHDFPLVRSVDETSKTITIPDGSRSVVGAKIYSLLHF